MSYSVHVFKKTKLQTFTNHSTNPIALVKNKSRVFLKGLFFMTSHLTYADSAHF